MKAVIVGGVAGGATAAARLRRLDENAEIVILERSGYVSYANCGLPYYVGDVITDRSKLTLQSPQSFRERFRIDVRVHQEAVEIDRQAQTVRVRDLVTGQTYDEPYDKLLLSPGAHAVTPELPGVGDEGVFTLRTVEDTFAIHDYIAAHQVQRVAIIGGGFIGLEMAENLNERGIEVHLFQRSGHVFPLLDADMAPFLQNRIRSHGVALHLNAKVQGIAHAEGGLVVEEAESNGTPADMVILAIGVQPESALAKKAGLALGMRDSIMVDEHLRTSDPNIYAVGDAVQKTHYVSGKPALIALAGPANKQGRIAADNMCGRNRRYAGAIGSSVMKMFDLTVATTGLNERSAASAGIDFDSVLLSPPNHATYYPGSSLLRLKVLFEKGTGRVLGAQAIGGEGADKRIDVLATALYGRMTMADLEELDLAYAPPYSSAKDPVNMAGYLGSNLLDGLVKQVRWAEIEQLPENCVLLDVRSAAEYEAGNVGGAQLIPLDELRERLSELPSAEKLASSGGTVYIHCQSGLRSYLACRILSQLGYPCANVAGGYSFYEAWKSDADARVEGLGPCGAPA